MPTPTIRPYQPADRAAVADICIRTGEAGGDARGLYPDPQILPDIFVLPYVELEPQHALVLADGDTAVGYAVATVDTPTFVKRFAQEWLPTVAARYPLPAGPATSRQEFMAELLHNPERMLLPEAADYPAHLHIDLLPAYQGAGHGRALLAALFAVLRADGAQRLHLTMVAANTGARAFYDRLGFHEIPVEIPGGLLLGRSTAP